MRVAAFLAVLLLPSVPGHVQSNPGASQTPRSVAIQSRQADSGVFTFHVTTREVVLDMVALDQHGGPVVGLTAPELEVYYSADELTQKHHHGHAPQPQIAAITSLRVVDPNAPLSSTADSQSGFRITASCLERSTLHYQLTFRPGSDGWTAGFHRVSLSTTRPGVRLFYRHRYFVGETVAPPKPPVTDSGSIQKLLAKDACNYPEAPLSISLRARLIDTGRSDVLRYQVAVEAGSLSYLTLEADTGARQTVGVDRRVQIDYGVCTFNAAGRPIRFFQASLDQILTSAEYARALALGFPHIFELPAIPSLALTRILVRDRATGNLGATDVPFGGTAVGTQSGAGPVASSIPGLSKVAVQDALARETARNFDLFPVFRRGSYSSAMFPSDDPRSHADVIPPNGPIGSFGSAVPGANSFCGDVYELEDSSKHLPDFRELDPIGSLYTYTLDVPNQYFMNTEGIPGVTPRTNLFGIDYHSVFWIRNAGDYQFRMVSDDGAILWIDDREVINLDGLHHALGRDGTIHLDPGRHTMHVPYYQGAVTSVALLLWIQLPGEKDWQLFDLRNFAPPGPGER
jgi:hypothetical protein